MKADWGVSSWEPSTQTEKTGRNYEGQPGRTVKTMFRCAGCDQAAAAPTMGDITTSLSRRHHRRFQRSPVHQLGLPQTSVHHRHQLLPTSLIDLQQPQQLA
ncbi:hypothetical protein HPB47_015330 [Ixodes persulcatus]|uniref:Uncharacterized protein n=1 Tax=Ixodes persulcatus TaxID=34615 RepID=A0AC60R2N4_IXOPE|nr:hypothetical protein HPB47_015330 [Ixodes persulcatus]